MSDTCKRITHLFTDLDYTLFHWDRPLNDHDGTSKDYKGGVVKRCTIESLLLLQEQGVKVVPCTGRLLKETLYCIEDCLEIEPHPEQDGNVMATTSLGLSLPTFPGIYNDGMIIADENRKIEYVESIDRSRLNACMDALDIFFDVYCHNENALYDSHPIVQIYHADDKTFLNDPRCELTKSLISAERLGCENLIESIELYGTQTGLLRGMTLSDHQITSSMYPLSNDEDNKCHVKSRKFIDLTTILEGLSEEILGIIVFTPKDITSEDIKFIQTLLSPLDDSKEYGGIDVRLLFSRGIVITPSGCNKAGGIKRYIELYKNTEDIELVTVIGDGENDIPMLKLAAKSPSHIDSEAEESNDNNDGNSSTWIEDEDGGISSITVHHSFVMGQAPTVVKKYASSEVSSIQEGGWKEAANRILTHNIDWATQFLEDESNENYKETSDFILAEKILQLKRPDETQN